MKSFYIILKKKEDRRKRDLARGMIAHVIGSKGIQTRAKDSEIVGEFDIE